jgi:hypothetical protein
VSDKDETGQQAPAAMLPPGPARLEVALATVVSTQ